MKSLIKTSLFFAVALFCVNTAFAQKPKVDKKAAKLAAFQKMIDTPAFTIVLEKAFPKDANPVNLAGSPYVSVSNNMLEVQLPYYAARVDGNSSVNIKTSDIVYRAQRGASGQKYLMDIQPKPGSKDWGDVTDIIINITTEEQVTVQLSFNSAEKPPLSYDGTIDKYKKME
jgi:hypothetical protein